MLLRERLERLGGEFFRLRGVLPLLALVEVPVAILRRGSVHGANSGQVLPLIALLIG